MPPSQMRQVIVITPATGSGPGAEKKAQRADHDGTPVKDQTGTHIQRTQHADDGRSAEENSLQQNTGPGVSRPAFVNKT